MSRQYERMPVLNEAGAISMLMYLETRPGAMTSRMLEVVPNYNRATILLHSLAGAGLVDSVPIAGERAVRHQLTERGMGVASLLGAIERLYLSGTMPP